MDEKSRAANTQQDENIIDESRDMEANGSVAVDTLVVGGGVQGLVLLNKLTETGYSTVLVTNSDLGSGQTLHSHGALNSGYLFPRKELRESLTTDWLPFANERGLQVYGNDQFFMVTPPEPYEQLQSAWDAFGYTYQEVPPDSLPSGFQNETVFGDVQTRVIRGEEYTFPKRQLIQILSDGFRDRIIRGEITTFNCASAASGESGDHGSAVVTVDSVDIQVHASGETVSLTPESVITAAGTGTTRLIESLIAEPSFAETESTLGAEANQTRDAIQQQLEMISYRRSHMLCIRAPKDVLPAVNLFLSKHQLIVVTANVSTDHDRKSDNSSEWLTWYVTPIDPSATPAEDVPDTAQAEVNRELTADGINRLLTVFPPLMTEAQNPDSKVKASVYAGYNQDIDGENVPVCEKITGMQNVLMTLPSVIPGSWLNAREAVTLIEQIVVPSGSQPSIPSAGEGVAVGNVTENTTEVTWLEWPEFVETFSDID